MSSLHTSVVCTTVGFIADYLVQQLDNERSSTRITADAAKRWIKHVDPLLLVRAFATQYAGGRKTGRESIGACYPVADPDYIEVMHLATVYSAIRQKHERLLVQGVFPTSFIPHTSLELVKYMTQVAVSMREVLVRVRRRDEQDGVALEKAISSIVSHREHNREAREK